MILLLSEEVRNEKNLCYKFRTVLSVCLAAVMAVSMLPNMPVLAKEADDKYPYTMFAASDEEGAITISAGNFCVNGNIATNGTIVSNGNMNVNGKKTEKAGIEIINLVETIDSYYFLSDDIETYSSNYEAEKDTIDLKKATSVDGAVNLKGRINIDMALKATEEIKLSGELTTKEDSVIFSQNKNIEIDGQTVNLNGLIYAPQGKIHITAQNLNMNSVVIISDTIIIDAPNVNANYGSKIAELISMPTENSVDYEKDTDKDGVYDYLEEYFGTDINSVDTDGDGLSDYDELFVTYTDPLLKDSDSNGINDGDEDLDGDGVSDGKEIALGTNPLVAEDLFTVNISADNNDEVFVSAEVVLQGKYVESLQVERYENDFLFPTTMPGYIGGAYDFSADGPIEHAMISFEFDMALLKKDSFDPIIYYFNEETQTLEELKTKISGNVASAEVEHFSKYILLDRKVYQDSFTWQDVWTTGGYTDVEVVLVIDDSSSMTSNDKNDKRLAVAKNLIDKLPEGSKIGVISFATDIQVFTTLNEDKDIVKSYLSSRYFKSRGDTYMYKAIEKSFDLFTSTDDSTLRTVIVLSDGVTYDKHRHLPIVGMASRNNIKIYTVGLGSSTTYFTNYLKPLANNTGGAFYLAANANQLESIYDDINNKIDIETDSDGDGIADYYEDNMVMFNGVTITLDKYNPDTDGDGVPDGEEVAELNYQYNSDRTKVIVTGKLLSNPIEKDSDYDGREDSKDAAPLDNDFSGTLKTNYATSKVTFKMDYRWFFDDNTLYNEDLSKISLLYASAIYHPNVLGIQDSKNEGETSGEDLEDVMRFFGLKDAETIELNEYYSDIHLSEVGLGYRTVSYDGELKNVLAVIIRGTDSSIEEWASNFDIGEKSTFDSTADWKNENNHKGFDIASNRIMEIVQDYIAERGLDKTEMVYWVTGHSRGAAIANIIGASYEKSGKTAFTYTFASPNTTLSSDCGSYTTVFNIINKDDFVPCLPMEEWNYSRYGKVCSTSIADNYEKEWENLTDLWDYNPDTYGMQKTVDALADIIPKQSDARIECYKYTCVDHGDGSNDTITITNRGISKDSREAAIAKVPANALPYCQIKRYDGNFLGGWNFDMCQTPEYFMQVLAAVMAKEISGTSFVAEINIAQRYERAKFYIISSDIGGLKHPHYTESYFVLANNVKAGDFK